MLKPLLNIAKFFGKILLFWSGGKAGIDLYKDIRPRNGIRDGIKTAFAEKHDLMASNRLDEEKVNCLDFDSVLLFWGINSEFALRAALRSKKIERVAGFLLFITAAAMYIYQMGIVNQHFYWRTLHGCASLSFVLLGLCLFLTAHWRIKMFQQRRFVPFLQWLKNRGRFAE